MIQRKCTPRLVKLKALDRPSELPDNTLPIEILCVWALDLARTARLGWNHRKPVVSSWNTKLGRKKREGTYLDTLARWRVGRGRGVLERCVRREPCAAVLFGLVNLEH